MSKALTRASRITVVAGPGAIIAALRDHQPTTVNPADLPIGPFRAAHQLASAEPDLILFGPDVSTTASLALADELGRLHPEIEIVIVAEPTHQLLTDAMRSGVREVVAPDASDVLLGQAVERVTAAANLRRTRLEGRGGDSLSGEGGVITVLAAKGGSGKSTIAVNLGVLMARASPGDVVLVDFDLAAGEIDLLLGLDPTASIATVATPGSPLDSSVIKLCLDRHASGLMTLAAPPDLLEADRVEPALLAALLTELRSLFPWVIVDTAPGAGSALVSAIEAADQVVAVATPDFGGLRSLRRVLDGLDDLGLVGVERHLLLNRLDARSNPGVETVEQLLELVVSETIPETPEMPVAANRGVPFVDMATGHPATAALRRLATMVTKQPVTEPAKPPVRAERSPSFARARVA